MAYSLADSTGVIDDFASIGGYADFRRWAREQGGALQQFVRQGFSEDLPGLASALGGPFKSAPIPLSKVRDQIDVLKHAVDGAQDVVIVTDGTSAIDGYIDPDGKILRSSEWSEEQHPRDERGKFSSGGGEGAPRKKGILEQAKDTHDRVSAFQADVNVQKEQVSSNEFWEHVNTPKGQAGLLLKEMYRNDRPEMEIHWLIAQKRGAGRAALEHVTKMADKHGVHLSLWALPLPGQGENEGFMLPKRRLEKFYREFGFKKDRTEDGVSHMTRTPRPMRSAGGPGSGNFGHSGRPGQVGGSGEGDGEATGPRTDTPAFKRWFKDSKVVDENGDPLRVYHGTTHDIHSFAEAGDPRLNPESDWGAGVYFSNTTDDVAENYAGVGPDLTSRIEQRIDQLTNNDEISREEAEAQARKELIGGNAQTVPVYLSMQEPFIVGKDDPTGGDQRETYLTQEFEYDNPDDPDSEIVGETGTLPDFLQALHDEAGRYNENEGVDDFIQRVREDGYDGISASKLSEMYRNDESVGYMTDDEGRLVSHEVFRKALERAGFDGIIDRTVDQKFGSQRRIGKQMAGMHEGTVHYVAFRPEQIKSAIGNKGTFDPGSPLLTAIARLQQITTGESTSMSNEVAALQGVRFAALSSGAAVDLGTVTLREGRIALDVVGPALRRALLDGARGLDGKWYTPADGEGYLRALLLTYSGDETRALPIRTAGSDWEEGRHPRGPDGKFSSGGDEGGGKTDNPHKSTYPVGHEIELERKGKTQFARKQRDEMHGETWRIHDHKGRYVYSEGFRYVTEHRKQASEDPHKAAYDRGFTHGKTGYGFQKHEAGRKGSPRHEAYRKGYDAGVDSGGSPMRDAAGEWNEEQHPRDESGKFSSGDGEGGGGKDKKDMPEWQSPGGHEHTGVTWKQPTDPKTGRPIPIKAKNVEDAIPMIQNGLVVEVPSVQEAHTLVEKLATMANEARAAGKDAKDYDLCNVTVAGTNLFCTDGLREVTFGGKTYKSGIDRLEMPQLGGKAVEGSEADHLAKNKDGEVNGSEHFKAYLQGIGMRTTAEQVPAASLKPSQKQLVGNNVGGMMTSKTYDPGKEPIFISRDNYVIDGHHRWAAIVGRDAADGKLGDSTMNVVRVNAPVAEVLHLADAWSRRFGIKQKGVGKSAEIIQKK